MIARRTMRTLMLLLWTAAMMPVSAQAIDLSQCGEDGVTEVPDFAQGRDNRGCLRIDPGNGDAAVPFQWEVFHRRGISRSATDGGETPRVDVINIDQPQCSNKNEGCSVVVWDTTIDHYLDRSAKNDDLLFIGAGHRIEYMLIKDSVIANTFTCKGGEGIQGPNGLSCAPGERSSSHVDGLQMRGNPVNNGWFVMQDTTFVNGFNLHMLVQAASEFGRLGSFVIQGGQFGRRQSIGAASRWIDDCERRRDNDSNGDDICPIGRAQIGNDQREVWFINVFGTTNINVKGNSEKLVIVNSGCDTRSCNNASTGFNNGWPHPLPPVADSGPGICPNGRIKSFNAIPTFCYTSLEAAGRDHKLPPFVHLSASGWANPGGDPSSPPPPPTTPPPAPERPNPPVIIDVR